MLQMDRPRCAYDVGKTGEAFGADQQLARKLERLGLAARAASAGGGSFARTS
jgi:hypothetical protein